MADQLQTVVAFDEAFAVNDAGVALHKRFTAALDAATSENSELSSKIAELEAKDTANQEKIAGLEAKLVEAAITPKKLDDAVRARKATMDAAAVLGVKRKDMEDMTEEEMKAAAVKKKMGDKAAQYDTGQIAIAFDTLAATVDAKSNPTKANDSLSGDMETPDLTGLGDAYPERNKRIGDAWKRTEKEDA